MCSIRLPNLEKILKPRALQTNFAQLPNFSLRGIGKVAADGIRERLAVSPSQRKAPIFVLDMGDSDFGSRANMGRGHDYSVLREGCVTSFESFLGRLGNTAVNRHNETLAESVTVLGSVDFTDLEEQCMGLQATEAGARSELIESVREVQRRGSAAVASALQLEADARVYLVNGDHDHMTSAVGGVYAASGKKPVVVYLDVHADSRPLEDGPHSGTWCCEIFDKGWVEHVYCVGLHPLSNSGATIDNLDKYQVQYEPFMWDKIKSGHMSLQQAAEDVVADVGRKGADAAPVVLSICGDTVLGLPASAGTGTIGFSADEVYAFVSHLCSRLPVSCLTVAELKTSLDPPKAGLVGEFLTQTLLLWQRSETH